MCCNNFLVVLVEGNFHLFELCFCKPFYILYEIVKESFVETGQACRNHLH